MQRIPSKVHHFVRINFCQDLNLESGISVGRVHLIFQLPVELGNVQEPLAYVEWFTPLSTYIPVLGMY
jgi:hypothetical protein